MLFVYFANKGQPARPHLRLHVRCENNDELLLNDAQNFLYDINVAYEILRLARDPAYRNQTAWSRIFHRTGRPLRDQDRLGILSLRYESPLEFTLWVEASVRAFVCLMKVKEILARLLREPQPPQSLDQQYEQMGKHLSDRDRIAEDLERIRDDNLEEPHAARPEELQPDPNAEGPLNFTGQRLEESPIRPAEIELTYAEPVPDPTEVMVRDLLAQAVQDAMSLLESGRIVELVVNDLKSALTAAVREPSTQTLLSLRKQIGIARRLGNNSDSSGR